MSSMVLTSGPPMSGTRPAGSESASSTILSATSPASMGWPTRPLGTGTTGSLANARTAMKTRSQNWVARKMVCGIGKPEIKRSVSSFTW